MDFLIGGTGRSGTTILSKIFSNHPQICDVPEWRFLIDPDGVLEFYQSSKDWSPYHYDFRLKKLFKLLSGISTKSMRNKLFQLSGKYGLADLLPFNLFPAYNNLDAKNYCPNFTKFCDDLKEDLIQFKFKGFWVGMPQLSAREMYYSGPIAQKALASIFRKFLGKIVEDVKQHQKVDFYLEKNTWNILWFDKIRELIPTAKLVHIYRDPRDVVTSFSKQTWMPTDVIQSAYIYRDLVHSWWKIKKSVPKESYFEISLEFLVANPRNSLMEICEFWQVPWAESLLDIDLSKSNSGRWKNELAAREMEKVEEILKDPLTEWGYE